MKSITANIRITKTYSLKTLSFPVAKSLINRPSKVKLAVGVVDGDMVVIEAVSGATNNSKSFILGVSSIVSQLSPFVT